MSEDPKVIFTEHLYNLEFVKPFTVAVLYMNEELSMQAL